MKTRHQVHNLIILDESGSMMSIKNSIISGFNELVQMVKGIEKEYPEQEHFISLVTFNGNGIKVPHFKDPVARLKMIDDSGYKPDSMTPLFDAMGFSIGRLRTGLEGLRDYNVLVTILTDGEENASREYDGLSIRNLVEELKLDRWTFTYIGTDHNVEEFASSISINNTMMFSRNEADINHMFLNEKAARFNFSRKIRANEDTHDNFYDTSAVKE